MFGCSLGPHFQRPSAPTQADYLEHAQSLGITEHSQPSNLRFGQDLPGQWWELFHSPSINRLVTHALSHNADIQAAQQALRVAQENSAAGQGNWPSLELGFNPSRTKTSSAMSAVPANNSRYYTLHTAQLNINYVFDMWSANRRQAESLKAQAEQQRFVYEATYLTLTSNVVTAAIQDAAWRSQIALQQRIIQAQQTILTSSLRQRDLGQLAEIDVFAHADDLTHSQITLDAMAKSLKQQHDLIAALNGDFPNQPTPPLTLKGLQLPDDIPVSLPAELTNHRPDMRAAEANWHAACAQYGLALANRFPSLSLSGNVGSSATALHQLFTSGQGIWAIAAQVTQPLFDGGTLRHRQRAAAAAMAQAAASYRSVVVTAFQNVADTLHALTLDAQTLDKNQRALARANRSLTISQHQFAFGDLANTALQQAIVDQAQAEMAVIQAQANQLSDTVALFQALGGGWWNR